MSRARGAGSPSIRQTSKPRRDTGRKPFSPHKGGCSLFSTIQVFTTHRESLLRVGPGVGHNDMFFDRKCLNGCTPFLDVCWAGAICDCRPNYLLCDRTAQEKEMIQLATVQKENLSTTLIPKRNASCQKVAFLPYL